MAFANGTYPATALARVTTAPGQMLRKEAAEAWDNLSDEVQRRFGWRPYLTDSYRPYSVQERIFRDRYRTTYQEFRPGRVDRRYWQGLSWWRRPGTASASTPGKSNHGLGLAVDASGLGGFSGTRYRQLASIAGDYGWSNATGRRIDEAWHWEFTGRVSAPVAGVGGAFITAPPALPIPIPPILPEDTVPFLIRVINATEHRDRAKVYLVKFGPKGDACFQHVGPALLEALTRGGVEFRQIEDGHTKRDYSQNEKDLMRSAVETLAQNWKVQ